MRRYWLVFSQAVTVLLAAYFVVVTLKPELLNRRTITSAATGVALVEAPSSPTGPPPVAATRAGAAMRRTRAANPAGCGRVAVTSRRGGACESPESGAFKQPAPGKASSNNRGPDTASRQLGCPGFRHSFK